MDPTGTPPARAPAAPPSSGQPPPSGMGTETVWRLVERIMASPREERDRIVEACCPGDGPMQERLRALVKLVDANEDLFEVSGPATSGPAAEASTTGPGPQSAATVLIEPPERPVFAQAAARYGQAREGGHWIGSYRLIDLLGIGGMGCVFLAEAVIEGVPVLRAVKVMQDRPGVSSLRFSRELRALASMRHPGIASVIETGVTARGEPFLVMEHVPGLDERRGTTLREYCDARRLGVRARIRLFARVCEAVQHAHDRGLIHRDLKPGNILVREDDGEPSPKVIDFGLAKALDRSQGAGDSLTLEGFEVGTWAYMSPEQGGLALDDLDTRTDVYSLGVILYELLIGVRPFENEDYRRMSAEARFEQICRTERARASVRLARLVDRAGAGGGAAADPGIIAADRSTTVAALQAELRRDLDWILARALDLDRDRRYGSPRELAADLERYLRGEPVLARPPSTGYRVRKFVGRNRLAVTAGVVVMGAVVTGGSAAGWQWRQAVAERNGTQGLSNYVLSLYAGNSGIADPRAKLPVPLAAIESAQAEFTRRFSGNQRLMKRLAGTFAATYLAAGAPGRTIDLLMPVWRNDPQGMRPEMVTPLAAALMRERDADTAVKVLAPVINELARSLGPRGNTDQMLADLRYTYAAALKWGGHFDAAEAQWRLARQARMCGDAEQQKDVLRIDYDLLLNRVKRFEAAGPQSRAARDMFYSVVGDRMRCIGDASEAVFGAEHEQTLACRAEAAVMRFRLGERSDAIAEMHSVTSQMDVVLGHRHWRTLEAKGNLGRWILDRGDPTGARRFLAEAYEGLRRDNPGSQEAMIAGLNLARSVAESGDPVDAAHTLRSVLETAEAWGANCRQLDSYRLGAAGWCRRWGLPDESTRLWEEAFR